MAEPLLSVQNLSASFMGRGQPVPILRGISFDLGREKVAIVGESGSGKSQTARAILRISPRGIRLSGERMVFDGIDLLRASERRMRSIRGNRISMILQDPRFSLNPLMSVGRQITEAYRIHHRASRAEARLRALEMLEAVQIRDPERVFTLHPHEISGGMGQRVMISMMLVSEPDLIIADEPTSALDVTVRRQVLAIFDQLVRQRNAGLIFISHDIHLVAEFCDRILVMYRGRIVEDIAAARLHEARHPYTQGLLACLPRLDLEQEVLPTLARDPAWETEPLGAFR